MSLPPGGAMPSDSSLRPNPSTLLSVWTKMFNDWIKALADPNNPFELSDAGRNNKQIIKPVGEMLLDPTSGSVDTGMASDPSDYLSNSPYSIGMKF